MIVLLASLAALVPVAVAGADAPSAGSLTLVHAVSPTTDPARVDLAVDGGTVGTSIAGGGAVGPITVTAGSHLVAATASTGTTASAYTSTVTCVDGATVLVNAATAAAASVDVAAGAAVVCTFTSTAIPVAPPPVVAPPVVVGVPILLPPPMVRGSAVLRGTEGCTAAAAVRSRISTINMLVIRFYRDGRLVRTIRNGELRRRVDTLITRLRLGETGMHVVTARIRFLTGAQPQSVVLQHRFGHCRQSAVTG
jgi:hypothetical protein